ncbi:MAG: hypothetical protein HG465_001990 [Mogibacterium sp.]|uniref:DUF6088 family protein n=1 Tax=Mogibacterium sp. TaxID=2049035 RepID=UPI0017EDFF76|nr:DUF6088 family protein [Mogibacterium sp.]MBB1532881.1 hypothetical protein [Mogibacterium sp.]
MNYKQEILNRIENFNSNKVFIATDFFDIAGYETVRSTLNRLVEDKVIIRIMKGFYYKPKYIKLIGEYEAPSVNEVANAIARKYNWTIAPSGNTALNLLGLSNQVPAQWTYISDGRYANFSFNNAIIEFKSRKNGDISKMSTLTAMVIQSIKAIGKDKITSKHIEYLRGKLSEKEKSELLIDGKATSAWVYEIIKKISEE